MANVTDLLKKQKKYSEDPLENSILQNVPETFHSEVKKSLNYVKEKTKGKLRLSGQEYYLHSFTTAEYLSKLGVDTNTILAALLYQVAKPHTIFETNGMTALLSELDPEVKKLIDEVEGFSRATKSNSDPEMKIKYIMRSTDDLRPILIKLAYKLLNARTIDILPKEKREDVAKNILEIYLPLCDYLNQYAIKSELEEIAFKIRKPFEFNKIYEELSDTRELYEKNKGELNKKVKEIAIEALEYEPLISSRLKGYYSVYKKLMRAPGKQVRELMDVIGFKIVVRSKGDVYKLANSITNRSFIDLEHYDDYIKKPKENGYQSIHIITYFEKERRLPVEFQILTKKMYQYNVYGPASHLSYKYQTTRGHDTTYFWIKQIHQELFNYFSHKHLERSHPLPNDSYNNKVFIFTPEKNIIELPIGSTPIDFAYKLHTDVGNQMIGVKINDKEEELWSMLQNGDKVEIIRDATKQLPDQTWLKYVRTNRAREEIESTLKKHLLNKQLEVDRVI